MVYWEVDALVAILGEATALLSANKYQKKAVLFGTVISKKLILRTWKADTAPTYDLWLRKLASILHLERLCNEDREHIFSKVIDWTAILFSVDMFGLLYRLVILPEMSSICSCSVLFACSGVGLFGFVCTLFFFFVNFEKQ